MTPPARTSSETGPPSRSGTESYDYFSWREPKKQIGDVSRLPFPLKVLPEKPAAFEDGRSVTGRRHQGEAGWLAEVGGVETRFSYRPGVGADGRTSTGVPAVAESCRLLREPKANPGRRRQTRMTR